MPPPEFHANRLGASDGARLPPPEAGGVAVEHCRVWLNWAAAQVEACLTSDHQASSELLAALAAVLGPAQQRPGSAPAPAGAVASGKISAVIIAVQSHDRVMQGLTHVAESLRALHALLGDARRANSAESWRTLRETQFRAFSMAQERSLFTRLVAHEDERTSEADLDAEDTVELFATDHGLIDP